MGSGPSIRKKQWVIMGRQDCICGRENICSKQQENHDLVDVDVMNQSSKS